MEQIPFLREMAIIAAVSVAVTVLLAQLGIPSVAGLLLAGALIGPFGLGLVRDTHAIEVLSEIGVVLLLFTIGLEFSLARLRHIFRHAALGGVAQVVLTIVAVAAIAYASGETAGHATFYGFVFALSSTAIVLKALAERRELDAPHGRFIVGALIFQDLCVVPMVLLVPLLAQTGQAGAALWDVFNALARAAGVVVGAVLVARIVVPRVLRWVDASRSREVFLLAVIMLCVGTAWLTSLAGLSLALGAFLGGMVVADTEYSHRAMSDMLPLRDAFVSLFFVSLGMLFDARVLAAQPFFVLVLLVGFVVGKGFLATLAAMAMRFPSRVAWLVGVGLAQFGEFGFVLVQLGVSHGVIDRPAIAPLLNAGIISMFLTPMLLRVAPHITAGERLLAPLERLLRVRGIDEADDGNVDTRRSHVVIVGYGVAGKLVARALAGCGVPYIVLELNADTVRDGRAKGERIYYADATSPEALEHAHIHEARAVVLLINDPQASVRVVDILKRVAPSVPILTRTRYVAETAELRAIGASDVVAEELEGGVEILARLLHRLGIAQERLETELRAARLHNPSLPAADPFA